MTRAPQAVLFDLDGTLVDTAGDLVAALYAACDAFEQPRPVFSAARQQVANGGAGLIRLAFGDGTHAAALQTLLDHYAANIAVWSSVYRPLDALIEELDGHSLPWGVVTNKSEALSISLLRELRLRPTRDCIVGGDTLAQRKPDPSPLLLAAEQLGVAPAHCVYIGDHRRDIDAAHAAGMTSIAAAYGYVPDDDPAERWNAHHVVDSPAGVAQVLSKLGLALATSTGKSE